MQAPQVEEIQDEPDFGDMVETVLHCHFTHVESFPGNILESVKHSRQISEICR